ncbi:MAG: PAS domain-containing protein [Anaerolineaceae bacterium]|nr:PAS domain-containing protein [Anaerolineaceae bacterium]
MPQHNWVKEFPASITVCNPDGVIIEMNDRAAHTFQAHGGIQLIGSNVLDCHPEPARSKLQTLLQQQASNVYTIEKHGARQLIYQAPWYSDGKYGGIIEIALDLPAELPHFVRD